MRVSQIYSLGLTQASLKFLDVDVETDLRLFINANAIRAVGTAWSEEAEYLIADFFDTVISEIRSGDPYKALSLLSSLREPNETHLGLSKAKSEGRGLGPKKAKEIWHSLKESKAVKTGHLKDLEDTVLLIDGVSVDIVSDIITNIIRGPLIEYTQAVCQEYDIPMSLDVASGPIWNASNKSWEERYVSLPTPDSEKLLLVPKAIVRLTSDYDVDAYYRHFVMSHLRGEEIQRNSSLVSIVRTGKNKGRRKVLQKDLVKKYGSDKKRVAIEQTDLHPNLLKEYKAKHSGPTPALSHRQIAEAQGELPPDWERLLADVINIQPGKKEAYNYEDKIQALLSALMYPSLVEPDVQTPLHGGLKRVDITFMNYAREGFFEWLAKHYPCPFVFVECKNFGAEIGNPEIDQISMRMAQNRGKFGILVCRSIDNRQAVDARCRAAAQDGHGFIVVLDDQDLAKLVESAKNPLLANKYTLLEERFKKLVM